MELKVSVKGKIDDTTIKEELKKLNSMYLNSDDKENFVNDTAKSLYKIHKLIHSKK